MSNKLIVEELGNTVKQKRDALNLSLRDASEEIGVSPSTISRIERGIGLPDSDSVIKLTKWAGIPMERIVRSDDNSVLILLNEPIPQIVDAILKKDKSLTHKAATSLSLIFKTAYQQISENK